MATFHFCSTDYGTPCAFTDASLARLPDRGWGEVRCVRHGCLVDGGSIEAPTRKEAHRIWADQGSDEYRANEARDTFRRQHFRHYR